MRTGRTLVMLAMLGSGLFLAGGCYEQQYKEAMAANRRAQEALQACAAREKALLDENAKLQDEIAKREAQIAARNQQIALLEQGRADLQKNFDELNARYQKLLADRGQGGPIDPLPAALNEALARLAEQYPDLFTYDSKLGMIKLKSDLTFAPGSDEVQPTAADALSKLVAIMQSAEAREFNVYIAGHTDDIPIKRAATRDIHPDNWYLSVHRAVSVEKVMESAGMSADRMAAMGFGEFHPIAPNAAGKKGNPLNRRVELWIVPPDKFMTGPASATPAE